MAVSRTGFALVPPSLALLGWLLSGACQRSGGGAPDPVPPAAPLLLAAGMETLASGGGLPPYAIDLARLGVGRVDMVFRLTTPMGEPFAFDVLSRAEGNEGPVRVSLAHVADGRTAPAARMDSIALAGCVPAATGLVRRSSWLDAWGDGFARMTLSGQIERDQLLAFEVESDGGRNLALVEIAIGARSAINQGGRSGSDHPDVVDEQTLYSSDSWQFGLPTAAVSGDRTSVVVYEGDRTNLHEPRRYELRLQHDRTTGEVTGGGSEETSPDSGHWRDHEVAALYNVLALAHAGTGAVTVRISFDRGASFAQELRTAGLTGSARLVQTAMAADYSLAVLYWHNTGRATELMLLEGRPAAVDATGSPTWYAFDLPQAIFTAGGDVTPLLTGAAWSEGGDLVVGHAFSRFETGPDRTWTSTTEFWCGIRPWGGVLQQHLLDRDVIVGRDPSVALLGQGPDLKIFYAYEGPEGLRLKVSEDAGATFSTAEKIGTAAAHTPTVVAREGSGGETRVDVIYMTWGLAGNELHLARWLDYGVSPREDYHLTTSVMTPTPVPGLGLVAGPAHAGFRLTQVAWLGYDAVLDGDEIVVAYDEETFDGGFVFWGAPGLTDTTTAIPPAFTRGFEPADPPPLALGMTERLPAPDPDHRHQLKMMRLR